MLLPNFTEAYMRWLVVWLARFCGNGDHPPMRPHRENRTLRPRRGWFASGHKKIHELLESEDSRDRNNAILEIFGYTDDRATEVFGKLLPALEDLRVDIDALRAEIADLRAEVEALKKQQKPLLTRFWSKKPGAKAS